MKKTIIVGTALLFCAGMFARTYEKQFHASIAPIYSIENGKIKETVSYDPTGTKFSELEWDNTFNSNLGFSVDGGWRFINLQASCLWGIPKDSGSMEGNSWGNTSFPGIKTRQYTADNKLDSSFKLNTRLMFDIPLVSFFNLQPYAGFGYSITKYTASGSKGRAARKPALVDGSFSLANKTDDYTNNVKDISGAGDVIDYTREIYDVFCGVAASFYLFDRVTLTADVNVSPFVRINAKDHHYLTDYQPDMYYLDIMQGAFQKWQFGAAADVKIFGGLSAGLLCNFELLNEISGEDYKSALSDSNYVKDRAYTSSTSSYNWEVGLYARYRFDFGPTHTPRVREPKAKKEKAPKVRNGKIDVRQY